MTEKKKHANRLRLEAVRIPEFSVFIQYEYLPHAKCGWYSSHDPRHHTYLISESCKLKYAVELEYGARFAVRKYLTAHLGKGGEE